MLVSLPLAAYIILLFVFRILGTGWRAAGMRAATVWSVLLLVIIETLSPFGWLTKAGLSAAWATIDIGMLLYLYEALKKRGIAGLFSPLPRTSSALGPGDMALLFGVGVVIALVGVTALLNPPNTWDAMEYHVPRVVHWLQNRSVAFYATHNPRQLHMPPLAEFTMLTFHTLLHSDRFDNLVQWFSLVGSVAGVGLLAQTLGAGPHGQVLGAIVCVSIPQGVLQASGAKNDYVLAFWLVALAYYLCRFKQEHSWGSIAGAGFALGLAWLTKGTGYIFSFALLLLLPVAWPARVRILWVKRLPLVLLIAFGLNTPHLARNYHLYGSPLGPTAEFGPYKYTNDGLTATALAANITRNLALHISTPSVAANRALERWIAKGIQALGGDIDDPRTTWHATRFHIPAPSTHEAVAGNPAHLLLIVLTLLLILASGPIRKAPDIVVYTLGLLLAFIVFCAVFRWQPWNTRLHLPLFVLWSATIATGLAWRWPRPLTLTLAVLLLALSGPYLLHNALRPLAPLDADRLTRYFADNSDVRPSYTLAAEFLKRLGCRYIGLDAYGAPPYEYPLLVLLGAHTGDTNVKHVGVKNETAIYASTDASFPPCAVICVGCSKSREKLEEYISAGQHLYLFQGVVVLLPAVDS